MAEEMFSDLSFEELDIQSEIKRALSEIGFDKMTPIQAQAIPALLTGRDVIGQAQTGTGKTAAFGIPLLERIDPENKELQAIVLCPTRELAMQAAGELRAFAKFMHDVKVLPVYGGQDISRQIRGLKGVQLVVGTPGRVMDHMRRHTVNMENVKMVVLDEADEMLDMGFREDMEYILGAIESEHQTCLFSATMPQPILEMTSRFQKDPEFVKITKNELTISSIHQYYYAVKREYKLEAIVRLLAYHQYKRSVIFCNTKAMVDELAEALTKKGYTAEGLHGDLNQKQRDYVMGHFRDGSIQILIATDIAARGIDVDDVEAVFNYDIPLEIEYYVHRIGRTGRAGKEGASHTLCRSRDFRKIHEIEAHCHAQMEERKVPTPAQIREVTEKKALDKVLETVTMGRSGNLIPVVRSYCETQGLDEITFAAACLRLLVGDEIIEDIEIDLPELKSKRRKFENKVREFITTDKKEAKRFLEAKRGRREGGRGEEFADAKRGNRRSDKDKERRGRGLDEKFAKWTEEVVEETLGRRRGRKNGSDSRQDADRRRDADTMRNSGKKQRTEMKAANKERSKRVLEREMKNIKAKEVKAKDIGRDGKLRKRK